MRHLLPKPVERVALRIAHRLRHIWRKLAKPELRGVSMILRDPEGRVLFVRHSYGPPNWSLPGGGIGHAEVPEDAARREMREELGLDLAELEVLGTIGEAISGAPHTAFVFGASIERLPTPDGREIVDVCFAFPDAPPRPLSRFAWQRLALLNPTES